MLPDMLVGIAKAAFIVGRKLGKQGDDVAGVAPASEDDQSLLFVHGPTCVVRESCSESGDPVSETAGVGATSRQLPQDETRRPLRCLRFRGGGRTTAGSRLSGWPCCTP